MLAALDRINNYEEVLREFKVRKQSEESGGMSSTRTVCDMASTESLDQMASSGLLGGSLTARRRGGTGRGWMVTRSCSDVWIVTTSRMETTSYISTLTCAPSCEGAICMGHWRKVGK